MSLQILRPPQLMQEAEWEEFALEAFAASDSWDAGAGRVFTFPPLSALWGPFPAEQVLLAGEKQELGASADPARWSLLACGDRRWDGAAVCQSPAELLSAWGGWAGHPQSTPHLSSCVCTSQDTSPGGVCDSESPIVFLLVWLGFARQGVNPPLLLASGSHTCKRVLWRSWGSQRP